MVNKSNQTKNIDLADRYLVMADYLFVCLFVRSFVRKALVSVRTLLVLTYVGAQLDSVQSLRRWGCRGDMTDDSAEILFQLLALYELKHEAHTRLYQQKSRRSALFSSVQFSAS